MNVRFLRSAQEDVVYTGVKFETMRHGWGDAFDVELTRAVASIEEHPRASPLTEDGPEQPENREYFVSRFEIRVIYAIWKNEAVIVAVVHARQKPGRWVHRLSELE